MSEASEPVACQCGRAKPRTLTMRLSDGDETTTLVEMHSEAPEICPQMRVDTAHWNLFMDLYFGPPRTELRMTQHFFAALISSLGGSIQISKLMLQEEATRNVNFDIAVQQNEAGFELSTPSRIIRLNGAVAPVRPIVT